MTTPARHVLHALGCLSLWSFTLGAQQVSDPDFDTSVEAPAYTSAGPTVAIDEAHGNFHTADGRYKTFADLLRCDGYKIVAYTSAFDRESREGITTQLDFSRENRLLGDHPIVRGRHAAEAVSRITAFTGQSLTVPPDAVALMKLSATAREAANTDDLDAEDAAARSPGSAQFGSRSNSIAGRAQGIAMIYGMGKLVVLGEAAMLSAQVARSPDGREIKMGMNVAGNDNRQFALNLLHWLSGLGG